MSEIKITDRRMFTPDGELREGFEDLENEDLEVEELEVSDEPRAAAPEAGDAFASAAQPVPEAAPEPDQSPSAEPLPQAHPESVAPAGAAEGGGAPHVELPPEVSPYGTPGFLDLVAMLAEPIAIYLGDAPMPGGESVENLDLARMHIDLLEVLREKSRGNLSSQELTIMDDLLYRLRMRYVEKRG